MNNSSQNALILSDGKPGHFHQSIALCQHLGLVYEICEVEIPTSFQRMLSHIFDLLGIYSNSTFRTKTPIPEADIIVSAGSRTYYANKTIARKLKSKSVAILAPRGYRWNFDALLVPEFDNPLKRGHIISLPINISYAEKELIAQNVEEFQSRVVLQSENSSKVGILLGGDNKAGKMDPTKISAQLDQVQANHMDSEIWVTTSRRTPEAVENDLKSRNFAFLHLFSEEPYNPIPAFIHLCDHLYVSTDSTSMLSECVSSGNAKISLIQTACSTKHHAMVEGLKRRNLIDTNQKINIFDSIQPLHKLLNLNA